jgi:hypothetical protein
LGPRRDASLCGSSCGPARSHGCRVASVPCLAHGQRGAGRREGSRRAAGWQCRCGARGRSGLGAGRGAALIDFVDGAWKQTECCSGPQCAGPRGERKGRRGGPGGRPFGDIRRRSLRTRPRTEGSGVWGPRGGGCTRHGEAAWQGRPSLGAASRGFIPAYAKKRGSECSGTIQWCGAFWEVVLVCPTRAVGRCSGVRLAPASSPADRLCCPRLKRTLPETRANEPQIDFACVLLPQAAAKSQATRAKSARRASCSVPALSGRRSAAPRPLTLGRCLSFLTRFCGAPDCALRMLPAQQVLALLSPCLAYAWTVLFYSGRVFVVRPMARSECSSPSRFWLFSPLALLASRCFLLVARARLLVPSSGGARFARTPRGVTRRAEVAATTQASVRTARPPHDPQTAVRRRAGSCGWRAQAARAGRGSWVGPSGRACALRSQCTGVGPQRGVGRRPRSASAPRLALALLCRFASPAAGAGPCWALVRLLPRAEVLRLFPAVQAGLRRPRRRTSRTAA